MSRTMSQEQESLTRFEAAMRAASEYARLGEKATEPSPAADFTIVEGDIFDPRDTARAQTIANPVNCRGAMGAGLAKKFAAYDPAHERVYRDLCHAGEMEAGKTVLVRREFPEPDGPTHIALAPTKDHWREPSMKSYIWSVMKTLFHQMKECGLTSVAMPALGAGLGGLNLSPVVKIVLQTTRYAGRGMSVRMVLTPKDTAILRRQDPELFAERFLPNHRESQDRPTAHPYLGALESLAEAVSSLTNLSYFGGIGNDDTHWALDSATAQIARACLYERILLHARRESSARLRITESRNTVELWHDTPSGQKPLLSDERYEEALRELGPCYEWLWPDSLQDDDKGRPVLSFSVIEKENL